MECPIVVIESPYAGDIDRNISYARAAMRDSLLRGEAPYASHLLYTQPGILRDDVPHERIDGIEAGLNFHRVATKVAFYVDHGWSKGMLGAKERCERDGTPMEERQIGAACHPGWIPEDVHDAVMAKRFPESVAEFRREYEQKWDPRLVYDESGFPIAMTDNKSIADCKAKFDVSAFQGEPHIPEGGDT